MTFIKITTLSRSPSPMPPPPPPLLSSSPPPSSPSQRWFTPCPRCTSLELGLRNQHQICIADWTFSDWENGYEVRCLDALTVGDAAKTVLLVVCHDPYLVWTDRARRAYSSTLTRLACESILLNDVRFYAWLKVECGYTPKIECMYAAIQCGLVEIMHDMPDSANLRNLLQLAVRVENVAAIDWLYAKYSVSGRFKLSENWIFHPNVEQWCQGLDADHWYDLSQ